MRIKKLIATLVTAGLMMTIMPATAMAATSGWQGSDKSGWRYYTSASSYLKNTWKQINGNWYFFNSEGLMESNCYRNGCWLSSSGAWNPSFSNGVWKKDSTGWWYTDNGWYPKSQWLWIDGNCYYFNFQGYMESNCYRDGYWLTSSGALDSRYSHGVWKKDSIGWWYEDNGWYPKNQWLCVNGVDYWFGFNGYWIPTSSKTTQKLTMQQARAAFEQYWADKYDEIGNVNGRSFTFSDIDSNDYTCVYILKNYLGAQTYEITYYYMDLTTCSVFTMEYYYQPESAAVEGEPGMWPRGSVANVFNAWDYLKDKVSEYVVDQRSVYSYYEYSGYGEYHVPKVLFESEYAMKMQQDIRSLFDSFQKDGRPFSTEYQAFISEKGILSIVFVTKWSNDFNVFYVWNFDINTGNKVDNNKIAEIAGVSDIRTSAMEAVQILLNKNERFVIKDYKLVSINLDSKQKQYVSYEREFERWNKRIELSFSEESLNDNMMIGLRNDGSIFFISSIASTAGADAYYRMYDINGNDLYFETDWVK